MMKHFIKLTQVICFLFRIDQQIANPDLAKSGYFI